MINKNELRLAMAKFGDNQNSLAEALGLSRPWMSTKINQRNGAVFSQLEILAIKDRYGLTNKQVGIIFFT